MTRCSHHIVALLASLVLSSWPVLANPCDKLAEAFVTGVGSEHYAAISEYFSKQNIREIGKTLAPLASTARTPDQFLIVARHAEIGGLLQEAAWFYRKGGEDGKANQILENLRELLSRNPILSQSPINRGASQTILVWLSDRVSAVLKPEFNGWLANPYHEVAAYEVDVLFGIDRVPMTVLREYEGQTASIQYFVQTASSASTNQQTTDLDLLDYLIANADRHYANWVRDISDRAIAIDHGVSFGVRGLFQRTFDLRNIHISKQTYLRMKNTPKELVQERIGSLLRRSFHYIKNTKEEYPLLQEILNSSNPDAQFELFWTRVQNVVREVERRIADVGEVEAFRSPSNPNDLSGDFPLH